MSEVVTLPPYVLAHGVGERSDLPLPVGLAQAGAVVVLLASFALLLALWKTPRFEGEGGRPFVSLTKLLETKGMRLALRYTGLLFGIALLAICLWGGSNASNNPGPTWFYVWFWVGLVPTSLLFGPVWRSLDPLPLLSGALRRTPLGSLTREYPASFGVVPAAIGLIVFTWMELVMPGRDAPENIARFVILYSVVQVIGGVFYGNTWHRQGDAFVVYSSFIACMSPWTRNSEGIITFANPLRSATQLPVIPGTLLVTVIMLGSTAFDGITRSRWWGNMALNQSDETMVLLGTFGLAVAVGAVFGLFSAALSVSAQALRKPTSRSASIFACSLIPIAIGYLVAHYFSLFVFQGQVGFSLLNDPFNKGWADSGPDQVLVDYSVASNSVISIVQVSAIVVGHVLGVFVAHEKAVSVFQAAKTREAQYPLLAVMVLFTIGGIGLLLGS